MTDTYDLFQQGRAHLRKGRAAQATVALEKAKRREPEKASIREALGIAYLRIERYEEAEQEFRKMLELSPADHYAHYALGRALEKQGRVAESGVLHRRLAWVEPYPAFHFFDRGLTAMRLGEICRIAVEDVDRQARTVIIRDRKDPKRKQGNDQTVPLLPDAWAASKDAIVSS